MTKTTIIGLLIVLLLSSCGMQLTCPAYKSALVLDDQYEKEMFSLFTVVEGDTVPKRPYGYKFKAEEGDTLMEKFIEGTSGAGFRVQRGRTHALKKEGFIYENRAPEKLWVKLFSGKEKPVLENPYLFDRIFEKRPFYQLETVKQELVHFNSTRHDSLVREKVNQGDSGRYETLMAEYNAQPPAIQAQHVPLLRAGFNTEQEEYNKRYRDYFLELEEPEPIDSIEFLEELEEQDSVAPDTVQSKGFLGLFKKGKKKDKEPKERRRDRKNNGEAIREEEEDN